MEDKPVKILYCDDWEGLFVNGDLITEGHNIDRIELLRLAIDYEFTNEDITTHEVTNSDFAMLYEYGCFPKKLSDLKGEY